MAIFWTLSTLQSELLICRIIGDFLNFSISVKASLNTQVS